MKAGLVKAQVLLMKIHNPVFDIKPGFGSVVTKFQPYPKIPLDSVSSHNDLNCRSLADPSSS